MNKILGKTDIYRSRISQGMPPARLYVKPPHASPFTEAALGRGPANLISLLASQTSLPSQRTVECERRQSPNATGIGSTLIAAHHEASSP
jgi:hypothetical protein